MAHPLEHQDIVLSVIPFCSGKRVLDCGCGKGIYGYLLRSVKSEGDVYIIGIDLAERYLRFLKRFHVYDDLILCDAKALPFKRASFDIVIASEIIEHLLKADGELFLSSLKQLATEKVIVTTPNGFTSQEPLRGIESERHLSGWSTTDLKKLGFRVKGYGFRFVKPTKHYLIYKFFDCIFTPISYIFPYLGRYLVACAETYGNK
jgi:2-polyprenyl-3-methyl-5-hydroxy-6-metoxy-1,4-benzoquinol methylase